MPIVINNIRHITDIEIKFVFTLLFICFTINIFKPLKYIFLFFLTIYKINPDKEKKNKNVPNTPSNMEVVNLISCIPINPTSKTNL